METLLCIFSLWISLKGNQVSFSVDDSSGATTAMFRAWTTSFSADLFHKSCIYFWLPWVNPGNLLGCLWVALEPPTPGYSYLQASPGREFLRSGNLLGCGGLWWECVCCITHNASVHPQQEEMFFKQNILPRFVWLGYKNCEMFCTLKRTTAPITAEISNRYWFLSCIEKNQCYLFPEQKKWKLKYPLDNKNKDPWDPRH